MVEIVIHNYISNNNKDIALALNRCFEIRYLVGHFCNTKQNKLEGTLKDFTLGVALCLGFHLFVDLLG